LDQVGILFQALSVFALRNLDLVKIESRPGRKHLLNDSVFSGRIESPLISLNQELRTIHEAVIANSEEISQKIQKEKYQNLFYLDFVGSLHDIRSYNALRHLAEIAPFIRVLGSYPRDGMFVGNEKNEGTIFFPTPKKSQKLNIGIVGYGRFGQFLANHLILAGHVVSVINLRVNYASTAKENYLDPSKNYFQGYDQIPEFFSQNLDCVIFSVSILSFEEVLKKFVPYLKNQLVVDVLSVKTHPKILLSELVPESCDILCTHPMFGPDSGKTSWVGLPFIYEKIRISDYHRVSRLLSFFEDKGCRMVQISSEEHDKLASGTQFITHFTGRMLSSLDLKATEIDTTGFKGLLNLVSTTSRDSFDLFYALFKHNKFSSEQLNLLEKAFFKVKSQLLSYEEINQKAENIVFNSRVQALEESRTSKITDTAKKMMQLGADMVTLSVGEPDFPPPQCVLDASIDSIKNGHTKYTQLSGIPQLRQAIANYLYTEKKVRYSPEEILCSCGGKQSIFQAILVLCRPGDEVIIPAPYWVSYPEQVKLAGAKPVFIEGKEENDFCITPEQLEAEIRINTRMIILCNPSNPTGHVYSPNQLENLAKVLRKHPQVFILSDELYEKILFDAEHVSFASLNGMRERTITVNGFSKAYSMTGYRLGYLAAPKPITDACIKVQSHNTTSPTSISQFAGVVAMEKTPPSYFKDAVDGFRKKRDFILSSMKSIGINCPVPQGAFYIFFSVKNYLSEEAKTSEEVCLFLIEKYHLALVPGEAFGMPGFVRISYAVSMETLEKAMDRLCKGLTELKNKHH